MVKRISRLFWCTDNTCPVFESNHSSARSSRRSVTSATASSSSSADSDKPAPAPAPPLPPILEVASLFAVAVVVDVVVVSVENFCPSVCEAAPASTCDMGLRLSLWAVRGPMQGPELTHSSRPSAADADTVDTAVATAEVVVTVPNSNPRDDVEVEVFVVASSTSKLLLNLLS